MNARVAILGGGNLAGAVAALLSKAEHDVVVWARNDKARNQLAQALRVKAAESAQEACRDAAVVVFAVPTHALRDVARMAGDVARGDQIALHACRGVTDDFTLPHQVIREETCIKKIGAIGGPLYLDDAARGRPLAAVIASRFDEVPAALKTMTRNTRVRIHATHDVIGVELCGAISNVSQIAAGLAEGAGLGETDQGILLMRGLIEAQKIGQALGAERTTFMGLAGVGDLIPRAVTSTRRNRQLGRELAEGKPPSHGDLEGPRTAREARALAERMGLSLPLVQAVDDVITNNAPVVPALERVLSLDLDLGAA
jgi:glycerol-3-phosphate dehydrogenase (NAD(P)+)